MFKECCVSQVAVCIEHGQICFEATHEHKKNKLECLLLLQKYVKTSERVLMQLKKQLKDEHKGQSLSYQLTFPVKCCLPYSRACSITPCSRPVCVQKE